MKRKILFQLILLLFCTLSVWSQNKQSFYFYSDDDILTIKQSATTNWGKTIVEGFRNIIQEREKYPMDIPVTEGSYIHDYFCPIHGLQFVFDWNIPKAHYCSACKKYWTDEDKYDWAWIALAHGKNLDYLVANMYMYIISDSAVYAEKAKLMLLAYADKYPGYMEHNRLRERTQKYSGKMFAQSLDEAVWAIDAARVFQVIEPEMSSIEKTFIRDNYLKVCVEMLMRKHDKGNWQAWHIGAIAALGVALQSDSIIDVAINEPEFGYRAVMKENVYPDGWWKEGSVVYHFYPLRSLALTAEAVRCRKIDLYNKQLFNMFQSPIQLAYADYSLPSQNDGWYGSSLLAQAGLYELAAKRFNEPSLINLLELCYQVSKRNSPYALINGMELDKTPVPLKRESTVFSDLGVAILRSRNRSVVLKYGPHGGVHGHPDKLSISVHDGVSEVLPDLGTPAYSLSVCREWYQNTIAHNTVTVDGKNQDKTCGQLIRFSHTKSGGYVFATTDKAYPGVKMIRELSLTDSELTDVFTCKSDSVHTYDYVLLFTEKTNLTGLKDTILDEYKHLSHIMYDDVCKDLVLDFNSTSVRLMIDQPDNFQVFTCEAPGILPTTDSGTIKTCYPVIIRGKSDSFTVKAIWNFKNDMGANPLLR